MSRTLQLPLLLPYPDGHAEFRYRDVNGWHWLRFSQPKAEEVYCYYIEMLTKG